MHSRLAALPFNGSATCFPVRPAAILGKKRALNRLSATPASGMPGRASRSGASPEGRRKRPAKPAVFLEGAKSEHEPQGVLPLERSVDEALQPFQVHVVGIPDVVCRRPVHPVQQITAGTQDALSVAPGEGGGQKARDGAVVLVLESMGNPQRVVLDEVGPLEPVGRLVEPFTPLRQPCGRGSATKRRGSLWHRGRRIGGFGAKFAFPMQFVHPEVLWALSALTLPVLVHLFSFRRHRKVQFSQTAFSSARCGRKAGPGTASAIGSSC